jgi:hypothetical protein
MCPELARGELIESNFDLSISVVTYYAPRRFIEPSQQDALFEQAFLKAKSLASATQISLDLRSGGDRKVEIRSELNSGCQRKPAQKGGPFASKRRKATGDLTVSPAEFAEI